MTDEIPPTDPAPVSLAPPTPRNHGGHELPSPEDAARAQFRDLALAAEGLSYAPPTRSAYLDAIITCPADRASPVTCAAMGEMSSCALRVRRAWLDAGVQHPILLAPYRVGRAVADLVEIAQWAGALRPAGYLPVVGDVVILSGPEHALAVVRVDGNRYTSIDGGQRGAGGFEAIARRERFRGVPGGVPHLDGRPVLYVVDCVALAACERWIPAAALGEG